MDISRFNANNNPRDYPEWIANKDGGAVPGVSFLRRMPKVNEWIHHRKSCHVRYVVSDKKLVHSWLREEYVENSNGRRWIQDAVQFRQQMKGKLEGNNASHQTCEPRLHTVYPARPHYDTPLEALRKKTQSNNTTIACKASSRNEEECESPPEIAGVSIEGTEWLPPDDYDPPIDGSPLEGSENDYGEGEPDDYVSHIRFYV